MRVLAFALALGLACTAVAGDTQSLVAASKASKEKKKKSTTKVITNADVKKSKGVVSENKAAEAPVAATPQQKSLVEQNETAYRERHEREELLAHASKRVADLERELAAVEESYYDEDDLDKRDREIARQFEDVKAKLDAARSELKALQGNGE